MNKVSNDPISPSSANARKGTEPEQTHDHGDRRDQILLAFRALRPRRKSNTAETLTYYSDAIRVQIKAGVSFADMSAFFKKQLGIQVTADHLRQAAGVRRRRRAKGTRQPKPK